MKTTMTYAEALRGLVNAPNTCADDDRIGFRVIAAKPIDAKVRIERSWQGKVLEWKRKHGAL